MKSLGDTNHMCRNFSMCSSTDSLLSGVNSSLQKSSVQTDLITDFQESHLFDNEIEMKPVFEVAVSSAP